MQGVKTVVPAELPEWAKYAHANACFSTRDLKEWLEISAQGIQHMIKTGRLPKPDLRLDGFNPRVKANPSRQWRVGTIRAWHKESQTLKPE